MEKQLINCMRATLESWYGFHPQESDSYGRIVNERHHKRLTNLLEKTSGKVVIGGRGDIKDRYLDLTVVTGVTMEDILMKVNHCLI